MGEVNSVRARVHNKLDIKVPLTGYKYSDQSPEPPVDSVLKTPFWSSSTYESLRQRLAKPVPTISVLQGGDYITVNTQTGRTTLSEEVVMDSGDEAQVSGSTVIMCCYVNVNVHVIVANRGKGLF
jgi:hypothetical protein